MASEHDDADLRRELADLRRQLEHVADANARAVELMLELEEVRAVEAALVRRAEELQFQRRVDLVLADSRDPETLARDVLAALAGSQELGLESGAVLIAVTEDGKRRVELARSGEAHVVAALVAACTDATAGDAAPTSSPTGALVVPLRTGRGRVGWLGVRAPHLGAWRERWGPIFDSLAIQLGNAITRLYVEERNRRLVDELAVALAATDARARILATMSHELRTPLNAVLGYGDLIRETATAGGLHELAEDAEKLTRAGGYLLDLVNGLLDLARIESGRVDITHERLDVRALVEAMAEIARPLALKADNRLAVACQADVMDGDVEKLRQILLNLLGNACKFTSHGEVSLRVEIVGDEPDALVRFTVADSGIGMSEQELARVFEPFTQANPAIARRYGGSGLGLAICRHYVGLMHGSLEVRSTPGRGTTFTVTLPRWHHG